MKTIENPLSPVYIGRNILESALHTLLDGYAQIALVYDSALETWARSIETVLKKMGISSCLLAVPSGEDSKCRAMKAQIEDAMLEEGIDRSGAVLALGGGVVTDLAGFVAATYLRGIPCISIPTTVLGMVDASIGGKTGINTPHGKNLIGSFHMPKGIVVDYAFLETVPFDVFRAGFAEVIKYGCTLDKELFDLLRNEPHFFQKLPSFVETCIEKSIHAKIDVVAADPKERGYRRVLNFGHTVAHALELLFDFQIPHGNAVATGMIGETYLSYLEGYLTEKQRKEVECCITSYQFPTISLQEGDFPSFYDAMTRDKKNEGKTPRFVLLKTIGKVKTFDGAYCSNVKKEHVEKMFKYLLGLK